MNKSKLFSYYWDKDLKWFRIFGYGIYAKRATMPMTFFEKHGYEKLWWLGKYRFGILKPLKF